MLVIFPGTQDSWRGLTRVIGQQCGCCDNSDSRCGTCHFPDCAPPSSADIAGCNERWYGNQNRKLGDAHDVHVGMKAVIERLAQKRGTGSRGQTCCQTSQSEQ